MLLEYHNMQENYRALNEDGPETCFDDLASILEDKEEHECWKIGMFWEDTLNKWDTFEADVNFLTNEL